MKTFLDPIHVVIKRLKYIFALSRQTQLTRLICVIAGSKLDEKSCERRREGDKSDVPEILFVGGIFVSETSLGTHKL